MLACALAGFEVAMWLTPFPAELESPPPSSVEFLDREGRPLRTLLVDERRYSRRAELSDVAPSLIQATISAEDRRFHRHCGVDPLAIGRALWDSAIAGRTSGASTITQQLVKITRPGPRTISMKVTEAWLAIRIEREWTKGQILTEYLNRLDYGNLQVGIAAASRFYFAKPPMDLSTAESAFLAGLPRAPSRLNPHANFSGAQSRQRWVLARMQATGALDTETSARALHQALVLQPPAREFEAPHFINLLLQRKGIAPQAGGRLFTTLDRGLNRFVERCLSAQLQSIAEKNATSGAVVVIDNVKGDVLALAASGDDLVPGSGQVNGAWIARSPGSAVKPFTYILALEAGANPSTVVADVPTDFTTESGLYRPNNYNHRFHGPVSLRFALGNSLNVGAIKALQLGGSPSVLHRRMLDLGITTLTHPSDYYGLGLTLGNGEMRLLELANAFATIGRLGVHRPYRLLLRDPGAIDAGRRVCDERATYLVADMMSDNAARSASFGLNSYLAFPFPVACKTGTSSDYRDNWAIGTTPEYTVGVWVGNADGSPMREITGVTGAAPLLHEIFTHLHGRRGTSWFARPAGIIDREVHPLTGRQAPGRRGVVKEQCLWPPENERPGDFDAHGRAILPAEYNAWMASRENTLGDLIAGGGASNALRVVAPVAGATYFLDPDVPELNQRIPLRATAAGIEWRCDTLPVDHDGARRLLRLREGRHHIVARDPASGTTAETWIDVKAL
jgi:penicillin-binding protein 1C